MKKNVGTTDKVVRVVLGLAIIALGIYYGSWWGLLGLILLATAAFSWCGLYALFGISTTKAK